jgi:hypothetical protein
MARAFGPVAARIRPIGRKLLVASIGVATLSYVGVHCGGSETTGASQDASPDLQTSGNLAPPPDAHYDVGSSSSGADGPSGSDGAPGKDATSADGSGADAIGFDALDDFPVANLVALPEAGSDGHGTKD